MDPLLAQFLPYLRCPVTGSSLKQIEEIQLKKINTEIVGKSLFHLNGSAVQEPMLEGLTTEDGNYIYPIIGGKIVVLLETLAMNTSGKSDNVISFAEGKKIIQNFYDEYGWKKGENNLFKDTLRFEDRRSVAEKYWSNCHLRLNKYLSKGKYILDVASGAVPNDEYFSYSDNYDVRICMDFSYQALKEASRRVEKGVFILGDVTKIPFEDACVDAVISLHTIYHVPQEEQTTAISEIYRILKEGKKAVIVYSWKRPLLMQYTIHLWRKLVKFYKGSKRKNGGSGGKLQNLKTESGPEMFVNQQDVDRFDHQIKNRFNADLGVYSAISRSFSNTFIRERAFGRQFANFIFKIENIFPKFCGRYGQYPVFILNKQVKEKGIRNTLLKQSGAGAPKNKKQAEIL